MVGIMLICTAWGRSMGGINSINYGLTKALGELKDDGIKIYCIVTDKNNIPDAETTDDMKTNYNIELIGLKDPKRSKQIEKIIRDLDYVFFVGHDVITGDTALQLKKKYKNSSFVIINHMDYSSYYYMRDNNPTIIEQKEQKQNEIIPQADIIFSIGPLLKKAAEDIVRKGSYSTKEVYSIIPGLEQIEPNRYRPNRDNVIVFGRIEDKNDELKQYKLILDALGEYIKKENVNVNNISIDIYGYLDASEDEQKKIRNEMYKSAKRQVSIKIHNYIKDEEELYNELRNSSLCIMPSTTEGFGLVAYEAIAAGVPVIITRNSGLYEFLRYEVRESLTIDDSFPDNHIKSIDIQGSPFEEKSYTDDDFESLVGSITYILKNYQNSKKAVCELRQILIDKHYSWEFAASQFLQVLKESNKKYFSIQENGRFINTKNGTSNTSNTKLQYKLTEYLKNYLLPRFCKAIMGDKVITNTEIKNVVCKLIAYSHNRYLRITALSSDKNQIKRTRIRKIENGTVGIMNSLCMEKKYFPVIFTDFVRNKCYYMSGEKIAEIKDPSIGFADHHVLSIVSIPLYSQNDLIGAITFDIYDTCIINQLFEKFEDYHDALKYFYSQLQIFSSSTSDLLISTIIEDDLNFFEISDDQNNYENEFGGTLMLNNRKIISFGGKCPFDCKHCFGCEIDEKEKKSIDDLVQSLHNDFFDVVYISQNSENLINPSDCIDLCEKIFNEFNCDIFITTRCILNDDEIKRFRELSLKMSDYEKNLTICVSIPAISSYSKTENIDMVPSPEKRIEFLKKLKTTEIYSMVTIRPLFPKSFIPEEEIFELVDLCKDNVDCVLTGGLMVTNKILENLGVNDSDFSYLPHETSEYLVGIEAEFKAVDVTDEMKKLKTYCNTNNVLFFAHSMDALNFFKYNPKTIKKDEE